MEFLFRTVGGLILLILMIVLVFIALFWPDTPQEPLPWLGIVGRDVDGKLVRQYSLPFDKGVLIERVFANSPAETSNLAAGDFVVKFNNLMVFTQSQLRQMIFDMDPQEKVWMTVYRDGAYYNVVMRLAQRPVDSGIPGEAVAFLPQGGQQTTTAGGAMSMAGTGTLR